MNSEVFAVFSRQLVKQGAMPANVQSTAPQDTEQEDPQKKSLLRRVALPAAGLGLGAIGLRQAITKAPRYIRHLRGTGREFKAYGSEMAQALKSPGQALKKGWKELGAAPGTEKRTNEIRDVLLDALSGKKYSLDVVDNPAATLRQAGIGSIGTRYHGRLNTPEVEKALGDVLHRRASGDLVLSRTATPEQIEKAYKNLQQLQTRQSEGALENIGDVLSRGASAITRNAPGERVVLPAMTGLGVYGEMTQKEDPRTGRKRGIAERTARAATNAFTGLAFNPIFAKQPGLLAGIGTQAASDFTFGQISGLAGRGIDTGLDKLRGTNQPRPVSPQQ